MAKQSRLVAIEGNTGCGKTSILHWLSTFPGVETRKVQVVNMKNFYSVILEKSSLLFRK